ncbi:MAG: hypothetical protein JXQ83_15515 [Candidatus Glassbacteria bacterium]|nr:hypothetical protein [Candidatus Glassbacteria bacterium]
MVVVGELEGLVSNHKLLLSRGSIEEAAKVKELIGGYLSKKDRQNRLYRGVTEKLEEFIFCAETNFEKFQEIINYKMLTQLEYFYPEYFEELTDNIEESAQKHISSGKFLYAGLLLASSRTADNKLMAKVATYYLNKKMYPQLERIFDRMEETRKIVLTLNAEAGKEEEITLFTNPETAEEVGRKILEAYSNETSKMEDQPGGFTYAQNAYLLANILSARLGEQGLLLDSSLVSSAVIFFKELARRTDIDNIAELVKFIENLKANPAARRFSQENPELFRNFLNSPDLRDVLNKLVQNLLGKTRFDEVNLLSIAMDGIISFTPTFNDHLSSLKENRFFVQAIEMAEKLQLTEALTEELKLEAFRKLLEDYEASQSKANLTRLKNFCLKHGIDCLRFPQLTEEATGVLEIVEKINPEVKNDLNQLYTLLRIERSKSDSMAFNPFKIFEPILLIFGWIFKLFLRAIMTIASRTSSPAEAGRKRADLKAKS